VKTKTDEGSGRGGARAGAGRKASGRTRRQIKLSDEAWGKLARLGRREMLSRGEWVEAVIMQAPV
jgi:hypothetical protein